MKVCCTQNPEMPLCVNGGMHAGNVLKYLFSANIKTAPRTYEFL